MEIPVFSPNTGKYGVKKVCISTLLMQCPTEWEFLWATRLGKWVGMTICQRIFVKKYLNKILLTSSVFAYIFKEKTSRAFATKRNISYCKSPILKEVGI